MKKPSLFELKAELMRWAPRPNRDQTWEQFFGWVAWNMGRSGVAYVLVRDNDWVVVPSDNMTVHVNRAGREWYQITWKHGITGSFTTIRVESDQVIKVIEM